MTFFVFAIPQVWLTDIRARIIFGILAVGCCVGFAYEWWVRKEQPPLSPALESTRINAQRTINRLRSVLVEWEQYSGVAVLETIRNGAALIRAAHRGERVIAMRFAAESDLVSEVIGSKDNLLGHIATLPPRMPYINTQYESLQRPMDVVNPGNYHFMVGVIHDDLRILLAQFDLEHPQH